MTDLQKKLQTLPKDPGVYYHKNAKGEIIYVGKAANLRNRVRQYFQKSRGRDAKTDVLVNEIADTDWMVVDSELDALFLEAEMVRRYMPPYNILLRDDKSMVYIRIDYDSDYPTVATTRRPLDDGARYFGPYLSAYSVRQALRLLRRVFPFATRRTPGQKRATLHYHLGLDPGLEEGRTSLSDYRANLRRLIAVIEGKRKTIENEIEKDMKRAAKASDFEAATRLRNQLFSLRGLTKQVVFGDKEFLDISKDHALGELVDLLGLEAYPSRIEGYDISHMQGSDVVASMVVFSNGAANKHEYRKFKTRKNHNDDFYNMHETLTRRLRDNNMKKWGSPKLCLIDGGKGQLDAALRARNEAGQTMPFIGLAKREEQIVIKKDKESVASIPVIPNSIGNPVEKNPSSTGSRIKSGMTNMERGSGVVLNEKVLQSLGGFKTESDDFTLLNLPHNTNVVKLLQRIRDESHRFAVSYHSVLKVKRQTASALDDIPGIGPATRKKLLRTFGSLRGITQASPTDLAQAIGSAKAAVLKKHLN
jgi:excinuclease ABC subunit C